jgi:prolyl 4-hydroxylase
MDADKHSPEVARAQALDADGRHHEAIDQLATAAQRGDVEATTRLAKRIIIGDRAPRLLREGIGLLNDAVNMGGAEAADRLAVIHAAGVVAAADWRAALRLLKLAAERGWDPARAQLEVLASMIGDEASGPEFDPHVRATSAQSPGSLVEEQRLRQLLVPAAASVLHEDPRICVFPKFVSAPVCDWLIARARGRLDRALVYDVRRQADVVDDSRTNSFAVFNAMEADLVQLMVQARMSVSCGQPVSHMEASTVLHYAVGETIGDHYDFIDPAQPGYAEEVRKLGHRVVTFLVYLNTGYEGGETVFPRLGLSHSGQRGEGLYFVNTLPDGQPDLRTLHNGRPPTRGEKWVFSQFVRNRPELITA